MTFFFYTNRSQGKAINVFGYNHILTNVTWLEHQKWHKAKLQKIRVLIYLKQIHEWLRWGSIIDEWVDLRHLLWYTVYSIYAAL